MINQSEQSMPTAYPQGEAVSEKGHVSSNRRLRRFLTALLALTAIGAIINVTINSSQDSFFVAERFQTFVTIFLGIFIEAAPFLLAGAIVSGFIAVFVDQSMIDQYLPKQPILAALSGALLGLVFPVCECGVVPVTRRLYEKGMSLSIGIAFLLAAPVINVIVFLSTYAAFGWGAVLLGRIGFTILIAFFVGLIFHVAKAKEVLRIDIYTAHSHAHEHTHGGAATERLSDRVAQALQTAGDDFIDMGRYLIIGSMLAATMQTVVPQSALIAVGEGSVVSVLVMQALAFVLSVCSTVDAFLALAFAGTFTTGSIIAFLTFGPMVDIKSALMFLGVFQRRIVLYLILIPFLMSLLVGMMWNVYVG
ncbi:MAG: permease [Chloroflexota bacterium]